MKIQLLTLASLVAFSFTAHADEPLKPTHKEEAVFNGVIATGSGAFAVGSGIERYKEGQKWRKDATAAQMEASRLYRDRQKYLYSTHRHLADEINAIHRHIDETKVIDADKLNKLEARVDRLEAAMELAAKDDPKFIEFNNKMAAQDKIVKSLERVEIGSQYYKALPGEYRVRANRAVLKGALGAAGAIVAGERAINHLYSDENIENRPALQEPAEAAKPASQEISAELHE